MTTPPVGFRTGPLDAEGRIANAEILTAWVRNMADWHNRPVPSSRLAQITTANGRTQANCQDYEQTLLLELEEFQVGLTATGEFVAFNNNLDTHVVVTAQDPATKTWILFDPTFAIVPCRASDGKRVSAGEISIATRAKKWNDIEYRMLDPAAPFYLQNYYADYPLLYLNVLRGFQPYPADPILPYLTETTWPQSGYLRTWVVQSDSGSAVLRKDGVVTTVQCNGVGNTSSCMTAVVMEAVTMPTTYKLYTPNRYRF